MNFFNRQKTRTPAETVKSLRENINRLDQAGSGESKRRVSCFLFVHGFFAKGAVCFVMASLIVAKCILVELED